MLRKIANSYWCISFLILTKNGERTSRDAFDKHIKIQGINKENVEFIPDNGGIRISACKRPEQSAQSSLLFYR